MTKAARLLILALSTLLLITGAFLAGRDQVSAGVAMIALAILAQNFERMLSIGEKG